MQIVENKKFYIKAKEEKTSDQTKIYQDKIISKRIKMRN